MPETFSPITWANGSAGGTPLNATALNRIEQGIETIDDRVAALEAGGAAPGARPPYLVVAAADAPAAMRTAADYVCDGASDQTEINAALTAANGAGGGMVQLTPGTFVVTGPIRMMTRTHLAGAGKATRIRAGSAITPGGTDTSYAFGWGGVIESFDSQVHRTQLSDFDIDGNFQNCHGIYYRTTGISDTTAADAYNRLGAEGPDALHWFTNIYIHEPLGRGVHLDGKGGFFADGVRVYGNGNTSNAGSGWLVSCTDSFFVNCDSMWCQGGHAWEIVDTDNHFANCRGRYSKKYGFNVSSTALRNTFTNCIAANNTQHGFYINSGPQTLTACQADSNSYDFSPSSAITGNTFNGFQIDVGTQVSLIGCAAYDKNEGGRGRRQQYGYGLVSSTNKSVVIGSGHNNAVGPITGASRTIADNFIYVTATGATSAWLASGGRAYLPALNSAPTDAEIPSSGCSVWLDESIDALTWRVRRSNGTYFTTTGTLAPNNVLYRVQYSGGAWPARPANVPAGFVDYVGPTQPTDWLAGDTWTQTS